VLRVEAKKTISNVFVVDGQNEQPLGFLAPERVHFEGIFVAAQVEGPAAGGQAFFQEPAGVDIVLSPLPVLSVVEGMGES